MKKILIIIMSFLLVALLTACLVDNSEYTPDSETEIPASDSASENVSETESESESSSDEETFTVSFQDETGTANVQPQTVKAGETAIRPKAPKDFATLDNTVYRFVGWYVGEEEFNFDTAINGDITIEVRWAKEENSVEIPI